MWYSRALCPGLYPSAFSLAEASVDGVASGKLYSNPSTLNTSLLYLDVFLNHKKVKAMIDTGANRTFISLQALSALQIQQIVQGEQESASLADGSTSLPVLGTLKLSVVISDISISMTTCVVRNLCVELILGMDFIQQYELILDVGKRVVSLCESGRRITLQLSSDREEACGPTCPVYATPITMGGLTLGTTTVPTLPFSKRTSTNQQLVNDHICKLTRITSGASLPAGSSARLVAAMAARPASP